ncbi:hypothetical protein F8M49_23450 [Rhodococcus zopfii]|uniref:Uncharacterized protein n=1 Tax=Rhodococcus zopfii TaxID=43772 RepID=A0ABU3WUB6_9NOCA|nr:hypothetical protein [Rhodococcus zopfii]
MPNDDIVEVLQRLETSLRKATAVGHRLIVETTERMIPARLGCRRLPHRHPADLRPPTPPGESRA